MAGYKKLVRPKQSCDFIRGKICRWEPQDDTSNLSTSVLNQKNAFNDKLENLGKGISLEKKPLKVYSRGKVRRNPISKGKMENFGALLEEDKEDLDSEIDGDNPLFRRPDLSSNSSYSDSEEAFHSDNAIKEDQDEELEGIRNLFGVGDHLVENDQNTSVQEDSGTPLRLVSMLQDVQVQKDGDQVLKVDSPNVVSKTSNEEWKETSNEEWKEVQHVISHLGLQLIPNNEKTHWKVQVLVLVGERGLGSCKT